MYLVLFKRILRTNAGGLQFDIFGTPFLRQVYAIFDIKGERFGVIKNPHEQVVLNRVLCDSPISMESIVASEDENEEIEDSVDGSILEEFPRRSSTMKSKLDTIITEESGLEHQVIPEESETEYEGKSDAGIGKAV